MESTFEKSRTDFESGQIVVDKERCWRELQLAQWYNEHSDFVYRFIHGDKDTFHFAWRRLGRDYAMPEKGVERLAGTMCQHDFDGRRIFQHRNLAKWSLFLPNPHVRGFQLESECLQFLEDLQRAWTRRWRFDFASMNAGERASAQELVAETFEYRRLGHDRRPMTFLPDGLIGEGAAESEVFWDVRQNNGLVALEIHSEAGLTCRLKRDRLGIWRGEWERHERMPVELVPARPQRIRTPILDIKAVMISCRERSAVRAQTLRNLAATDWGDEPVHVQLDVSTAQDAQRRQEQTSRAALESALQWKSEFILFLEDDLEFNRHILRNLESWPPLLRREITLAGLYNPNIGWIERNDDEHWMIANPETIYGSQAFLLSREAVEHVLSKWEEVEGMQDIRMSRLAGRLGKPLYYHEPSLVQHTGRGSVWGGCFHQAVDFDGHFRARQLARA